MPRLSDKPVKATPTASDQITIIDVADSDAVKLATFADAPVSTPQSNALALKANLAAPAFTGDVTFDTDTLVVDSVNNRVALGTTSPQEKLHVHTDTVDTRIRISNSTSGSGADDGAELVMNSNNLFLSNKETVGSSIRFNIAGTTAQTIDASGQVGIGTSSPDNILQVGKSGQDNFIAVNRGSDGTVCGYMGVANGSPSELVFNSSRGGGQLVFKTVSVEAVRIDASGNVLIGKTSTASNVVGAHILNAGAIYSGVDAGLCGVFNRLTSDGIIVSFRQDSTEHGSISISGSTTSYNTSSDHRLKENVIPMTGALARIDALKPSRFNFIAKPDRVVDGFIAHEVQEVVPEAVTGEKDAMKTESFIATPALGDLFTPAVPAVLDEEGNEVEAAIDEIIHDSGVEKPDELADGVQWRETQAVVMGEKEVPDYQGIDQGKLAPLTIGAVQELHALVKSQSDLINDLTTRIAALEA